MTNTPTPPDDLEAEVRGLLAPYYQFNGYMASHGLLDSYVKVGLEAVANVVAALRKQRERGQGIHRPVSKAALDKAWDENAQLKDQLAEAKAERDTAYKDIVHWKAKWSDKEYVRKLTHERLAHLQAALAKVPCLYRRSDGALVAVSAHGNKETEADCARLGGRCAFEALATTGGKPE